MAESLELGLNEAKKERNHREWDKARDKWKNTFKAYKHNERANNWRTNENLERNKFNSTPQNKQDYTLERLVMK